MKFIVKSTPLTRVSVTNLNYTTMTFQTLEVKYETMRIKGLLKKKKPQVVVKK